ncbi:MAG: TRAM domain-containing protein [Nanobdellota archaeon]
MSEEQEKPVSIGDVIDVKIEAVGKKGDGIAKINNFVIFVPEAKEGEEIKVKVNKVLNKVAFANKVEGSAKKQETEVEEESNNKDNEEEEDESDSGKEEESPKDSEDF